MFLILAKYAMLACKFSDNIKTLFINQVLFNNYYSIKAMYNINTWLIPHLGNVIYYRFIIFTTLPSTCRTMLIPFVGDEILCP